MLRRLVLLSFLCGLLVFLIAQQPVSTQTPASKQPPKPPQDLAETQDMSKFVVTLQQVTAPVLVFDGKRSYVNGLQPEQFQLFDNNKEQNLTSVDLTYTPISLVVAIQANTRADKILPQVNKIGAMLKPIVLGDQGEAAVIAFDHRVRLMQPFTSDADDLTKAIKGITPGSSSSRLLDAVEQSTYLLSHRPKNRRRIILVIGEGRDYGSQAHSRETLEKVQLANVVTYWVDMSHWLGLLTTPAPDPRPNNMPPAMQPMPGGVPATPTTVDQAYGTNGGSADFLPLLIEIFQDATKIFKVPAATLYTKGTGGEQFSFASQKGLESAISEISNQLHSQYLITYTPNNTGDGGFHHITVNVIGHPNYKCETKPGYFMSPKF